MNVAAFALTLTTTLLYGAAQVLGKVAVRDLNATTYNAIHLSLVALLLTPFVLVNGLGSWGSLPTLLAVASGATGLFFGNQLYFYCMKRVPAHRLIPIANSYPVLIMLLAPILLGEIITPFLPLSVALVVGGAFLLSPKSEQGDKRGMAVLFGLIVALAWGLNHMIRKYAINIGVGALNLLWLSTLSAAIFTNLSLFLAQSWRGVKFNKINVSASLSSGILLQTANLIFLFALGLENISALAPVASAVIPIGFLLSILIVKERPIKRSIFGMIVVFLGVILATL